MSGSEIAKSLGKTIREHRKAHRLSQERFGELAGVHRTYVGMIERGEKNITLSNLVKIANALGLTLSELIRAAEKKL